MEPEARSLFLKIARCPIVEDCLRGEESDCRTVVLEQCNPTMPTGERLAVWKRKHHLPEPWVGHLESAPLLFLSSNPGGRGTRYDASPAPDPKPLLRLNEHFVAEHPSLGRPFEAMKWEWEDDALVDKGESLFQIWTEPTGRRPYANAQGELAKEVPYWKGAHEIASQIFTHIRREPVRPGIDYALTEAVRCKSSGEIGVDSASRNCVPLYLKPTLRLSPAPVVIVFGRVARQVVRKLTGFEDYGPITPPLSAGDETGRSRTYVFLEHPTTWRFKTDGKYPKALEPVQSRDISALVESELRGRKYVWEAGDVEITKKPPGRDPRIA